MAEATKMPLGMKIGLGPGDFVLDGDPDPLHKNEAEPPIFGPCLMRPNDWMDQDRSWYGGRPQNRRPYVTWGSSPPPPKGVGTPPQF